ncbi:isoleucine--tRNA ligase [Candidatus Woesearchaeota archaeon]|jgi:isoleucyl-tRNA synthetase|nr:isoleucine--tRNA ligase [Candidatus Woesearchaeota archaeon]
MRFPLFNPQEIEPKILRYWNNEKIIEQTRERNKKGKKFYFLDGPPYTSGRLHLGHAWNYALKDTIIRYKRMTGHNVWDRNGFDMHGLPTAHKVMAKHKLETKEDIIKFGLAKFIQECIDFSKEMADLMVKDLQRMGISLKLDDPYMPITPEFIEGEWQFFKKADQQKRLYYGEKVLTWCSSCETALAKHECEYQTVNDNSIFVKFPVKGKKNEFLIIWTTTPWTIPFNLAVMVNPTIDYVRAKVEGETWIVAKVLAGPVIQAVADKKYKIIEEFKGKKLEGLEYTHPWEDEISQHKEIKKEAPNAHTVILTEQYADTSAGSGLVHSAPGCGPEDQEACKPYKIPPFNNLNEKGIFPNNMGKFSGLTAKKDDKKFITALEEANALIATTQVEHEYPHCWRCKHPVIFRITYQWFLKIEDIKEKMLLDNAKTKWVPETANNSFKSWVSNLRDNSVSRQRFWGTPLPIWKCEKCEKYDVLGSREEIKKLAGTVPKNLHMPWIDEVKYDCKCGGTKSRVSDVIDVWVDAGTTAWNCLRNDPKLIKEWFPADLILEAKEQTRLWFSMLSICSQIMYGKNCYNNVYVYGMLTDIKGVKMSKSLGNIISPYELIDKHGVDTLRYYMCQNNAGQDINFSWDECALKQRYLNILWNTHKFLINLANENKVNPFKLDAQLMEDVLDTEEKYIFSRLHHTIKEVKEHFEAYQLDETLVPIENLFLDLSRTYIQMIRDKASSGEKIDKEVCIYTITQVLMETLKIFAPLAPFVTEAIYLNLKEEFKLKEKSIHHHAFPEANKKRINVKLEEKIDVANQIIQSVLNLREKLGYGVRWPLREIVVTSDDKTILKAVEELRDIIKKQTNLKDISVMESLPGVETTVKPDFKKLAPIYKELTTQIITKLSMDSPQTILGHLEKSNSYDFKVSNKKVSITKEHVIIENKVPEKYLEGSFRKGFVYLTKALTSELEGEGFSREIIRNVQQLRKEAGLQKLDRIILYIKLDEDLLEKVKKHQNEIKEKVGADKFELSAVPPVKKHPHHSKKKIKKEEIEVWLDKI